MQEKVRIRDQIISKDYKSDRDLAWAWQEREDQNYNRRLRIPGAIVDYWGPSQSSVEFIQTVPNWKDMTNEELRSLVLIDYVISSWNFFVEEKIVNLIEDDVKNIRQSDIERWRLVFPNRPINSDILAIVPTRYISK